VRQAYRVLVDSMKATSSFYLALSLAAFACSGEHEGSSTEPVLDPLTPPAPISSSDVILSNPNGGTAASGHATSGLPQNSEEACASSQSALVAEKVALELLVDTSRSMTEVPTLDTTGKGQSKWVITQAALSALAPKLGADLDLGLSFYPGTSDLGSNCLVKQQAVAIGPLGAPGSAARSAFQTALDRARPDGGTPTHEAYEFGVEQLLKSQSQGKKYLLLITDGIPTFEKGCQNFDRNGVDTAPLIEAAADAFEQGVHTFVIGSPGSENARVSLSKIARAGGTATSGCSDDGPNFCHFDMTTDNDLGSALTTAFGTITDSIASCEYRIPTDAKNIDPSRVNVLIETPGGKDESIGRDPSETACDTGWQYSSDRTSIVLCEDTCARVKAAPSTRVQVLFGCQTQRAPGGLQQ
jgi:von Willebrand factor type A domain